MSYLADDTAAIKARMEEIRAERRQFLTGSSAPATDKPADESYVHGWAHVAADYDPA